MIDLMDIAAVEDDEEKRRLLKEWLAQFTDDEKRQLLDSLKVLRPDNT